MTTRVKSTLTTVFLGASTRRTMRSGGSSDHSGGRWSSREEEARHASQGTTARPGDDGDYILLIR